MKLWIGNQVLSGGPKGETTHGLFPPVEGMAVPEGTDGQTGRTDWTVQRVEPGATWTAQPQGFGFSRDGNTTEEWV